MAASASARHRRSEPMSTTLHTTASDASLVDSPAGNTMISLRNVEKYYQQGVTKTFVLRRITLDIKEGEFVSIMGPSGAGKSTLLHVLGMHDTAWTGEFYFADHPIHKLGKKERAEL